MVTDTKYPPSVKAGKPILGETPEGWARESLKKHLTLEQRKVKVLDEKEYDLVTVKRSRGGVVRREHLYGKQISVKSQFSLKQGDFLISKRQIVHGACGIVPAHLDGSIVSNEYSIFTAKDSFDLTYLRYLSETLYFQQTCFHSSIGVHIEKMIFKLDNWFKWDFNLPPLPEQRKIAQILSTWDRCIATTEKLIDASKQQKKALMQQLLTGKKRLVDPKTGKAFEGEWEEVKLGDVISLGRGFAFKSSQYADSGTKVVRVTNIASSGHIDLSDCVYVPNEITNEYQKYALKNEDILLVMVGATAGKLGFVSENILPSLLNQNMWSLRTRNLDKLNQPFLRHIAERIVARYMLTQQGSARGFFTQSTFELVNFQVPSVEEQKKIASVLTAADKEIELLEAKLAHLKQEKKALMQQLLTGKRRVKVAETEAA